MEKFNVGDEVYIRSDCEKNILKPYEIFCLNKAYSIIKTKSNNEIYKKISLNRLTKFKEQIINAEVIKKGDLVKCIINNHIVQEGLVIDVYNTFILVLIGQKKKKVSKNRALVINN